MVSIVSMEGLALLLPKRETAASFRPTPAALTFPSDYPRGIPRSERNRHESGDG